MRYSALVVVGLAVVGCGRGPRAGVPDTPPAVAESIDAAPSVTLPRWQRPEGDSPALCFAYSPIELLCGG